MLTMNPAPGQLDDLLDARAQMRALRQELVKRRIAVKEVKDKLATLSARFEDVLTEIEVKQGRLSFDQAPQVEEAVPAPAPETNGRKRPKLHQPEATIQ